MMEINNFGKWFGGDNVRSTKSTNTGRQAFNIDPDADIVDAKFTVLDERKPFIYTQNSQNNPENSERFFSAQENSFNFSKSAPFSQTITADIAQSYRSFSGSTKYGSSSGSFSSFNNQAAQVGRQLVLSA
jgi:hypothetical protein